MHTMKPMERSRCNACMAELLYDMTIISLGCQRARKEVRYGTKSV